MISIRRVQSVLLFSNTALLFWNRNQLYFTLSTMPTDDWDLKILKFEKGDAHNALLIWTFYLGFISSELPFGFYIKRYNTKFLLLMCTFVTGLFSCFVPCLVNRFDIFSWKYFYALRIMQGLIHGCAYPAQQQHLTKWSPQAERGLASGLSAAGLNFGETLGIYFSLEVKNQHSEWVQTFYLCAASCFLWCVFWYLLGATDCNTSKFISIAERRFVERSLGNGVSFGAAKISIPWREILKSTPFWSVFIVRTANQFTYSTILYFLPLFKKSIFQYKKRFEFYSIVPFLVRWLATYVFVFIGVWLMRRNFFSLTVQRKIFNSIGMWLPAAFSLCIGYIETKKNVWYIVLYTLVNSLNSATAIGCGVSLIDIAPNHMAILATLVNIASKCSIMLGALLVGVIVGSEDNNSKWNLVFIMLATVFCVGDLIFLIWGTAEEQPWNSLSETKIVNIKDKKLQKSIELKLKVYSSTKENEIPIALKT